MRRNKQFPQESKQAKDLSHDEEEEEGILNRLMSQIFGELVEYYQ
jgi:hypothetical protein